MSQADQAPFLEPDEYARLIRAASDQDLENGLRENGDLILEQIFLSMPAQLRREATTGVELVAEWRIRNLGDSDEARWQVAIVDQTCHVSRDSERTPDLVYTIRALDFIKLISGNAKGPALFLFGRLKIEGDLLKAARFQGYFRTPRPD
jgi:putative sterol carrier protein